jgi:hypothetical protein
MRNTPAHSLTGRQAHFIGLVSSLVLHTHQATGAPPQECTTAIPRTWNATGSGKEMLDVAQRREFSRRATTEQIAYCKAASGSDFA